MNEIEFLCANCGSKLSADLSDAGAECDCPNCGRAQVIPDMAPIVGAPVAAISKAGRKKITVSGSMDSSLRKGYPEVVDDTPIGRIFRFLAAVLGLGGLACMGLAFFCMAGAGTPRPPWLESAVSVAPLLIAGFTAIIVARVAFIVGSIAVRYER